MRALSISLMIATVVIHDNDGSDQIGDSVTHFWSDGYNSDLFNATTTMMAVTRMCDVYSHSTVVPLAIPTLPKSIFNICTFKLITTNFTITTTIIIILAIMTIASIIITLW